MSKPTRLLWAAFLTGMLIGSAVEAVEARYIIRHMPLLVVKQCTRAPALAPGVQL